MGILNKDTRLTKPSLTLLFSQFTNYLFKHTIAVLVVIFCTGIAIALSTVSHLSLQLIETQARENAALSVVALNKARSLYSQKVTDRAKKVPGITVTNNYHDLAGGIPNPATFTIELGEEITANTDNFIRLFSDYPFLSRQEEGGAKDDFERDALKYFAKNPDRPFFRKDTSNNQASFRYAEAILMESSCVGCHNNYPGSPRRDWKVGDVRGALEISLPLDNIVAQSNKNLRALSLMLGGFSALGILGISVVVSRLKHISQELTDKVRERTTELERLVSVANSANQAKSQFLASMSHELRTPLNAILGFTQILQRNFSLDGSQKEYLGIIERSGEHLLQLINDILELSKIEANKTEINNHIFDLYSLLSGLSEMLSIQAKTKELELHLDCAPNVPQYVEGDEKKLRQILINLLNNSIKFTEQGYVSLQVTTDNDIVLNSQESQDAIYWVCFTVEDTGIGIPKSEQENLFTAFTQTKLGQQYQEGTGLGLAISRKFVTLMKGEISFESEVGKGTTFTFRLPFKLGQACAITSDRIQRKIIGIESGLPTYRILIVDDSVETRIMLQQIFTPLGFEVKEATNGREAVDIFSSWFPHLIWMDLKMPVMNGYEATKQIKNHHQGQKTKIIALTANVFEREQSISLSAGCDDFVSKPFSETKLLEKMAEHLNLRYIYEDLTSATTINHDRSQTPHHQTNLQDIASPSERKFVLEQLQFMSVEWLNKLYRAAEMADNRELNRLIEEITAENPDLAKLLANLIKEFRVDRIFDVTEQILNSFKD